MGSRNVSPIGAFKKLNLVERSHLPFAILSLRHWSQGYKARSVWWSFGMNVAIFKAAACLDHSELSTLN
ncbi:hypothetical protein PN498_24335 [Oscillatoria sp. CS-180]|uniref:hypothetical protein n=1 Tax=Oscillatoria sp. CS-180 TaxID=3021720 RepID=UPI00232FE13E|nr:hypothetical protein [Oscillatoria sp. CS-180]MDB9529143.1 hypothetical protein [Oscillatoria sp. CS-180]